MAEIIQFPLRGVYARHYAPPPAARPVVPPSDAGKAPSPCVNERNEQRHETAITVVRLMPPRAFRYPAE